MAEESHVYNAVFKAQGVQEVLAGLERLGGGFTEVFQAFNRLARVDPISLGEMKGVEQIIRARDALRELAAAQRTTAAQVQERGPEGMTLAEAERQRAAIIEKAEAGALARLTSLGQSINRQIDLREKTALQMGLGRQAQQPGPSYQATRGFASDRENKLFQDALDAERQMLNAQQAKAEAVEKGLTSETRLNNLNEQIYRAQRRMEGALEQMASIAQKRESDAARIAEEERSDMLATDARRQADLETARLAKQEAEARRRRVADLEAAFGVKPGSAIFSKENALTQEEIDQLHRPAYDPTDVTAVGRLTKRRAALAQNLANVEAEMVKADADALAGLVERNVAQRRIRDLLLRQQGIQSEITKNEELIATATNSRAKAEALSQMGPLGRARGEFMLGFKGERDLSYAQQVGQAFKFSVFYGTAYKLLFAFTQTLQQTLQEGIAFQQGMTDLAIASGRTKDQMQELGERLGAAAAAAGAAPSQGVEIGARAIGLYGASGASQAEQERVAEISARVVSRMAVGSPISPVDLQAQVAAITQALGLGTAGQFRVADLDAFLTKRFGAPQGSTLEAVSQSASVGRAAGFTDEQLFALAADLISRTGQSSTAVGGYLAQIFSRGGEGSLTDVAQRYNIDTTQTLAEITKQLAQVYASASPNQRAEISAAFGRGKIQNAAVALLGDYNEVLASASDAKTGAAGAADKQFTARINDIGGQINLLSGSLKEFAHLLGESGILSLLGLGIVTFRELLDAVNDALTLYNQIPSALKDMIGAFLAAEVALRLAGKGGVIAGVGQLAAGARFGGVGRTAQLGRLMAGYGATEASAAAGAAAAGTGGSIAAAAGVLGPVVAVAAAVYALTDVVKTLQSQRQADRATVAVLGAADAPGVGSASSAYRAQAESLQAVADQQRDATGWVAQAISFGHANDAALKTAEQLDKEAKRLNEVADAIDLRPQGKATTFASLDDKGIKAGFDQITQSGGTAREQLKALNEAIYGLGQAAVATKGRIDVGEQAQQISRDLVAGVKGFDVRTPGEYHPGGFEVLTPFGMGGGKQRLASDKVQKAIRDQLSGSTIQKRLQAQLDALGVTNIGQLTPEQIDKIADEVSKLDFGKDTELGKLTGGAVDPKIAATIQKILRDNIVDNFKGQVAALRRIYSQDSHITMEEALAGASNLMESTAANLDRLSETDYTGRAKLLHNQLRGLRAEITKAGTSSPQLDLDVSQTRQALVANAVTQLEALRHAAVANAKSQAEATRIGRGFVAREIRRVVRGGGNADQLRNVLSTAGKEAIAQARQVIEDAIEVAKAALAAEQSMQVAATSMTNAVVAEAGVQAGDKSKQTRKEIRRLNKLLEALQYVTPAENPDQVSGAAAETAEERRAARLSAEAARRGGQIAPARAAVAQALAELHKAKKGTVEYYNALSSYYQARDQLNEAFRNYRHILRELKIDTTDPLAEANLTLQEARRKLRDDTRRGKGRDVLAQDKLDIKNAQNQQEATAFSQRLEDVQTADELGRISHAAYLRYLQSEHNRLTAIAHRTRQQQDQLNQIDKLMKDAAGEMQGAFNIGDIKLPTPYEVRRYIKTQVTSTPYALSAAGATSGSTTIYINGADTGAVRRIIDETVGKGTRVLTTTTRRT